MAKEFKSITVNPNGEQRAIHSYACFGWNLVSSQEIYAKDSHLERRLGRLYSVTQTTNYVKLVFERDPSALPNYAQLRELEKRYHAVALPKKKLNQISAKRLMILRVIMCAFVIFMAATTKDWGAGIIMLALLLGFVQAVKMIADKNGAEWKKALAKQDKILMSAEKYL